MAVLFVEIEPDDSSSARCFQWGCHAHLGQNEMIAIYDVLQVLLKFCTFGKYSGQTFSYQWTAAQGGVLAPSTSREVHHILEFKIFGGSASKLKDNDWLTQTKYFKAILNSFKTWPPLVLASSIFWWNLSQMWYLSKKKITQPDISRSKVLHTRLFSFSITHRRYTSGVRFEMNVS